MAAPMTAAQWLHQMEKWDVNVEYLPGWINRGRFHLPFQPIGIMIHHTGSDSQAKSYIRWLFTIGRPAEGIPAPLAHVMSMMDGRLIVGARGRANHAGRGVAKVRNLVGRDAMPLDKEVNPGGVGSVDGNTLFYGDEGAFDGGQPMTDAQYETTVRWCAAICDFHGWGAGCIVGHGEWTSNKWDPGKTDMARLRRDVNALLKAGPNGNGDDDMAAEDVWNADLIPVEPGVASEESRKKNPTWKASSALAVLLRQGVEAEKRDREIAGALEEQNDLLRRIAEALEGK